MVDNTVIGQKPGGRRRPPSKALIYLRHIAANQVARVRGVMNDMGARHADLDLEASLKYIHHVHDEYLREGGIKGFYGRVAEIGPGDNCGVALLMLADGAKSVDLIDRFFTPRDPDYQARIYERLINGTPSLARFAGKNREEEFDGIKRYFGAEAAAERFFINHRGYDMIVSGVVLEHLADPILALKHMREALNPGGLLLHAVDLADHGMFTKFGYGELSLLEVPDFLYRSMISANGKPNRFRLSDYKAALPDATFRVASLADVGLLDAHSAYEDIPQALRDRAVAAVRRVRSGLATRFRSQSDVDLSVQSFYLIYRKPMHGQ